MNNKLTIAKNSKTQKTSKKPRQHALGKILLSLLVVVATGLLVVGCAATRKNNASKTTIATPVISRLTKTSFSADSAKNILLTKNSNGDYTSVSEVYEGAYVTDHIQMLADRLHASEFPALQIWIDGITETYYISADKNEKGEIARQAETVFSNNSDGSVTYKGVTYRLVSASGQTINQNSARLVLDQNKNDINAQGNITNNLLNFRIVFHPNLSSGNLTRTLRARLLPSEKSKWTRSALSSPVQLQLRKLNFQVASYNSLSTEYGYLSYDATQYTFSAVGLTSINGVNQTTRLEGYFVDGRMVEVTRHLVSVNFEFQLWTKNTLAQYPYVTSNNTGFVGSDSNFKIVSKNQPINSLNTGIINTSTTEIDRALVGGDENSLATYVFVDSNNQTVSPTQSTLKVVANSQTANNTYYANYARTNSFSLSGVVFNGDEITLSSTHLKGLSGVEITLHDNKSTTVVFNGTKIEDQNGVKGLLGKTDENGRFSISGLTQGAYISLSYVGNGNEAPSKPDLKTDGVAYKFVGANLKAIGSNQYCFAVCQDLDISGTTSNPTDSESNSATGTALSSGSNLNVIIKWNNKSNTSGSIRYEVAQGTTGESQYFMPNGQPCPGDTDTNHIHNDCTLFTTTTVLVSIIPANGTMLTGYNLSDSFEPSLTSIRLGQEIPNPNAEQEKYCITLNGKHYFIESTDTSVVTKIDGKTVEWKVYTIVTETDGEGKTQTKTVDSTITYNTQTKTLTKTTNGTTTTLNTITDGTNTFYTTAANIESLGQNTFLYMLENADSTLVSSVNLTAYKTNLTDKSDKTVNVYYSINQDTKGNKYFVEPLGYTTTADGGTTTINSIHSIIYSETIQNNCVLGSDIRNNSNYSGFLSVIGSALRDNYYYYVSALTESVEMCVRNEQTTIANDYPKESKYYVAENLYNNINGTTTTALFVYDPDVTGLTSAEIKKSTNGNLYITTPMGNQSNLSGNWSFADYPNHTTYFNTEHLKELMGEDIKTDPSKGFVYKKAYLHSGNLLTTTQKIIYLSGWAIKAAYNDPNSPEYTTLSGLVGNADDMNKIAQLSEDFINAMGGTKNISNNSIYYVQPLQSYTTTYEVYQGIAGAAKPSLPVGDKYQSNNQYYYAFERTIAGEDGTTIDQTTLNRTQIKTSVILGKSFATNNGFVTYPTLTADSNKTAFYIDQSFANQLKEKYCLFLTGVKNNEKPNYTIDQTLIGNETEGFFGVTYLSGTPYPNPVFKFTIRHRAEQSTITLSIDVDNIFYAEALGSAAERETSDVIVDFTTFAMRDTASNVSNNTKKYNTKQGTIVTRGGHYSLELPYIVQTTNNTYALQFKYLPVEDFATYENDPNIYYLGSDPVVLAYCNPNQSTDKTTKATLGRIFSTNLTLNLNGTQISLEFNQSTGKFTLASNSLSAQNVTLNDNNNTYIALYLATNPSRNNPLSTTQSKNIGGITYTLTTAQKTPAQASNYAVWTTSANSLKNVAFYDVHTYNANELEQSGNLVLSSDCFDPCTGLLNLSESDILDPNNNYDQVIIAGLTNIFRVKRADTQKPNLNFGYANGSRLELITAESSANPYFYCSTDAIAVVAEPNYSIQLNKDLSVRYRFKEWKVFTRFNSEVLIAYNGSFDQSKSIMYFSADNPGYYLFLPVYERVYEISVGITTEDGNLNMGGNISANNTTLDSNQDFYTEQQELTYLIFDQTNQYQINRNNLTRILIAGGKTYYITRTQSGDSFSYSFITDDGETLDSNQDLNDDQKDEIKKRVADCYNGDEIIAIDYDLLNNEYKVDWNQPVETSLPGLNTTYQFLVCQNTSTSTEDQSDSITYHFGTLKVSMSDYYTIDYYYFGNNDPTHGSATLRTNYSQRSISTTYTATNSLGQTFPLTLTTAEAESGINRQYLVLNDNGTEVVVAQLATRSFHTYTAINGAQHTTTNTGAYLDPTIYLADRHSTIDISALASSGYRFDNWYFASFDEATGTYTIHQAPAQATDPTYYDQIKTPTEKLNLLLLKYKNGNPTYCRFVYSGNNGNFAISLKESTYRDGDYVIYNGQLYASDIILSGNTISASGYTPASWNGSSYSQSGVYDDYIENFYHQTEVVVLSALPTQNGTELKVGDLVDLSVLGISGEGSQAYITKIQSHNNWFYISYVVANQSSTKTIMASATNTIDGLNQIRATEVFANNGYYFVAQNLQNAQTLIPTKVTQKIDYLTTGTVGNQTELRLGNMPYDSQSFSLLENNNQISLLPNIPVAGATYNLVLFPGKNYQETYTIYTDSLNNYYIIREYLFVDNQNNYLREVFDYNSETGTYLTHDYSIALSERNNSNYKTQHILQTPYVDFIVSQISAVSADGTNIQTQYTTTNNGTTTIDGMDLTIKEKTETDSETGDVTTYYSIEAKLVGSAGASTFVYHGGLLSINVGGKTLQISNITKNGNEFDISIKAPSYELSSTILYLEVTNSNQFNFYRKILQSNINLSGNTLTIQNLNKNYFLVAQFVQYYQILNFVDGNTDDNVSITGIYYFNQTDNSKALRSNGQTVYNSDLPAGSFGLSTEVENYTSAMGLFGYKDKTTSQTKLLTAEEIQNYYTYSNYSAKVYLAAQNSNDLLQLTETNKTNGFTPSQIFGQNIYANYYSNGSTQVLSDFVCSVPQSATVAYLSDKGEAQSSATSNTQIMKLTWGQNTLTITYGRNSTTKDIESYSAVLTQRGDNSIYNALSNGLQYSISDQNGQPGHMVPLNMTANKRLMFDVNTSIVVVVRVPAGQSLAAASLGLDEIGNLTYLLMPTDAALSEQTLDFYFYVVKIDFNNDLSNPYASSLQHPKNLQITQNSLSTRLVYRNTTNGQFYFKDRLQLVSNTSATGQITQSYQHVYESIYMLTSDQTPYVAKTTQNGATAYFFVPSGNLADLPQGTTNSAWFDGNSTATKAPLNLAIRINGLLVNSTYTQAKNRLSNSSGTITDDSNNLLGYKKIKLNNGRPLNYLNLTAIQIFDFNIFGLTLSGTTDTNAYKQANFNLAENSFGDNLFVYKNGTIIYAGGGRSATISSTPLTIIGATPSGETHQFGNNTLNQFVLNQSTNSSTATENLLINENGYIPLSVCIDTMLSAQAPHLVKDNNGFSYYTVESSGLITIDGKTYRFAGWYEQKKIRDVYQGEGAQKTKIGEVWSTPQYMGSGEYSHTSVASANTNIIALYKEVKQIQVTYNPMQVSVLSSQSVDSLGNSFTLTNNDNGLVTMSGYFDLDTTWSVKFTPAAGYRFADETINSHFTEAQKENDCYTNAQTFTFSPNTSNKIQMQELTTVVFKVVGFTQSAQNVFTLTITNTDKTKTYFNSRNNLIATTKTENGIQSTTFEYNHNDAAKDSTNIHFHLSKTDPLSATFYIILQIDKTQANTLVFTQNENQGSQDNVDESQKQSFDGWYQNESIIEKGPTLTFDPTKINYSVVEISAKITHISSLTINVEIKGATLEGEALTAFLNRLGTLTLSWSENSTRFTYNNDGTYSSAQDGIYSITTSDPAFPLFTSGQTTLYFNSTAIRIQWSNQLYYQLHNQKYVFVGWQHNGSLISSSNINFEFSYSQNLTMVFAPITQFSTTITPEDSEATGSISAAADNANAIQNIDSAFYLAHGNEIVFTTSCGNSTGVKLWKITDSNGNILLTVNSAITTRQTKNLDNYKITYWTDSELNQLHIIIEGTGVPELTIESVLVRSYPIG